MLKSTSQTQISWSRVSRIQLWARVHELEHWNLKGEDESTHVARRRRRKRRIVLLVAPTSPPPHSAPQRSLSLSQPEEMQKIVQFGK